MLNITALGFYMILASVSGNLMDMSATGQLVMVKPQLVEERNTKEEIAKIVSTEERVRKYFSDIPILVEVSRCESSFRQVDSTGQTLRGMKNNKDLGAMQINEYYHGATAKKMNIDLHTLEGNLGFARYLYEREGARPWLASSKCWSKSNELAQR